MRICLDVRFNARSGLSSYIWNFLRHLATLDQKNEYLLLMNRPIEGTDLSRFETIHVPHGGPVIQMSWIQGILPGLLKRKGVEIYHSLKHVGPIYSPTKTIHTVAAAGQYSGVFPVRFKESLYWKHLQGTIIKRADFVVAHSNFIRNCLMDYLGIPGERVVTIYNGRDDYFEPLHNGEAIQGCLGKFGVTQPFLLCVGNVVPVKNYRTLLKAHKLLVETGKTNMPLVIAGDTKDRHFFELKQLIGEWKMDDSVKFIGQVSKQDLLYLYNAAEMLIHPSLHEGFCAAIVEAMACGLPVVCSSTTSLPEVVGDAAMLYGDPEDAAELASRMESLIGSKATRDRLSERALKRAGQFSWNRCVNETVGLYAKLSH